MGFVGSAHVFDLGPDPIVALYGIDTHAVPNALVRYDVLTDVGGSVADLAAHRGQDPPRQTPPHPHGPNTFHRRT